MNTLPSNHYLQVVRNWFSIYLDVNVDKGQHQIVVRVKRTGHFTKVTGVFQSANLIQSARNLDFASEYAHTTRIPQRVFLHEGTLKAVSIDEAGTINWFMNQKSQTVGFVYPDYSIAFDKKGIARYV